ncbi:MAG TPA: DUF4342 domain-containing protein [Candidatus Sulfomarinibacteraceae bacterium]|nr:DUF4342 domain-containing protein [Candidatus Sulfomarinibacteraceae bacterium]
MMEEKNFEEQMNEEIHVEEEEAREEASDAKGQEWTEEFVVAGEELVDTVKRLVKEANVRRIVIKNKEKRILFEIPFVVGLAGIAFLPIYSALALIAALVTECTITVERVASNDEEATA